MSIAPPRRDEIGTAFQQPCVSLAEGLPLIALDVDQACHPLPAKDGHNDLGSGRRVSGEVTRVPADFAYDDSYTRRWCLCES